MKKTQNDSVERSGEQEESAWTTEASGACEVTASHPTGCSVGGPGRLMGLSGGKVVGQNRTRVPRSLTVTNRAKVSRE